MASKAYQPEPLDTLLSAIPSLPRPMLDRLVARMIDHMDELDGDPDLEPDEHLEDDDPLEQAESEDCGGTGFWAIDQRRCVLPHLLHVEH